MECEHCGKQFKRDRHRKNYCSKQCARQAKHLTELSPPYRKSKGTRFQSSPLMIPVNNRIPNEKYVEEVSLWEVMKRDKFRCRICGKGVRTGVHPCHPKAPTRDHIIPLSKGGEHSYANVQLAHYECNLKKADNY